MMIDFNKHKLGCIRDWFLNEHVQIVFKTAIYSEIGYIKLQILYLLFINYVWNINRMQTVSLKTAIMFFLKTIE